MENLRRWLPLAIALALAILFQLDLARRFSRAAQTRARRIFVWGAFAGSLLWLVVGAGAAVNRLHLLYPPVLAAWLHASTLAWILITVWGYFWVRASQAAAPDLGRRRFVGATLGAVAAAPVAVAGYGVFIERNRVRLEEVDVPIRGIPNDLNGLRIAQISDIHLGPFLSVRELDAAVDMLNETKPNLTVMTGDLISRRGDPLDECIQSLGRLRAEAGVYGCMGNHERYARVESYTDARARRLGMRFLRAQSVALPFGKATLNLAGVDYQRMRRDKIYLPRGGRLVMSDAVNVLLSHNPDVFPSAAERGFQLTLAGHTHGGQVNVEILDDNWNVARFYTPYTSGLYKDNQHHIYVNRGLGTIGLPMRLGAPPEVTILRLCAA